jgi:hypothetical protein
MQHHLGPSTTMPPMSEIARQALDAVKGKIHKAEEGQSPTPHLYRETLQQMAKEWLVANGRDIADVPSDRAWGNAISNTFDIHAIRKIGVHNQSYKGLVVKPASAPASPADSSPRCRPLRVYSPPPRCSCLCLHR